MPRKRWWERHDSASKQVGQVTVEKAKFTDGFERQVQEQPDILDPGWRSSGVASRLSMRLFIGRKQRFDQGSPLVPEMVVRMAGADGRVHQQSGWW